VSRLLRSIQDLLFPGRREDESIPPLDGAWTPNDLIESGRAIAHVDGLADAVALDDGTTLVVHGSRLTRLDSAGAGQPVAELPGTATCLAVSGDRVAVGVEDHGVVLLTVRPGSGVSSHEIAVGDVRCPTALAFDAVGRLWIADGSAEHTNARWQRDLLLDGRSGRVLRLDDPDSAPVTVASSLAWPAGLAPTADGSVVVSEAWRYRVVELGASGTSREVMTDLPGYPGQLTPTAAGGHCLALFAPRTKIVDFVMSEPQYRDAMIERLDPVAWVAPTLRTTGHPREQVQGGQLLVFGQVKPWAPCRSFGLLVEVDSGWTPLSSWHSRSDGNRHGVVRGWAAENGVVVVSAGAGEVIHVEGSSR